MTIDGLHIPTKCWKVIYIKKTKTYEYYIFNNTPDKPVGLDKWKVKKEEVEKLTGFKFNL
jgi:DNA/RNA endonuclease G (NUC1)